MKRRIIAALAVMLVYGLIVACGSGAPAATITSPTSAPGTATSAPNAVSTAAPVATTAPEATAAPAAPTIAKLGDRVDYQGVAMTVAKAERTTQIGKYQKAQDGREFIVVDVLFENVSAEKTQADYNPFYFKVKDVDGYEFNATLDMGPNSLKSGNLDKGGKARGTVVFDVAKGAKGLVMSFQNATMTLQQTTLQWTLGDV